MKLLRYFIRLRAAGRELLSGRRNVPGHHYAVTVPQPLRNSNVSFLPMPVVERVAVPTAASSAPLRMASGR